MLRQEFIGQPTTGTVANKIAAVLGQFTFSRLHAALAYATVSGTHRLVDELPDGEFQNLEKRWLVGVDWCRSQPLALETLQDLDNSSVRIHDGAHVVQREGCYPRTSYHPKAWILTGDDVRALIAGSANLSRNGLTVGHEANMLLVVETPATPAEQEAWGVVEHALAWFDATWNTGSALADVLDDYRARYEAFQVATPTPTDDDAIPSDRVGNRYAFTPQDLMKLADAEHLWIQAGNITENRGEGLPGNELMMRRLTRVYFAFEAEDLERDTFVGNVNIEFAGTQHPDRTIRFSNNHMDVLTLPVPGNAGAPAAYDQETLLFKRETRGGRVVFVLSLAGPGDENRWRRASTQVGGHYVMRGTDQREFGVF